MRRVTEDAPAGTPKEVKEVDGRLYRVIRRYVSLGSKVSVTVTDSRKQMVVEVLEPMGGK